MKRKIIVYLRVENGKTTIVDINNKPVPTRSYPTIFFAETPQVIMRMIHADGSPFDLADITFDAFEFGIDNDWDRSTNPAIFTNSGIITEEITIDTTTYSQFVIDIDANTTAIEAKIGTQQSVSGFYAELNCFTTGNTSPDMIIQFPCIIQNKLIDTGTEGPQPPTTNYYTKLQADALYAQKENSLGNPSTDDYVLASKTDGTRAWVKNGVGDMEKSVYDTNNSGVVDNAEKVNGLTVETAVPPGAVFTDTVYDDSNVLKNADTLSPVTSTNKIITEADISTGGGASYPPIALIAYPVDNSAYTGTEFEGFISDIPNFLTSTLVKTGLKYTTTTAAVSTLHEVTSDITIPTTIADGDYTIWIDKNQVVELSGPLSLIPTTTGFYYDIAAGNLYENGTIVEKCPIGQCTIASNAITAFNCFYKGNKCSIPINSGNAISINTTSYESIPFYALIPHNQAAFIFANSTWNYCGNVANNYGFTNYTKNNSIIATYNSNGIGSKSYANSTFDSDYNGSGKFFLTIKRGF